MMTFLQLNGMDFKGWLRELLSAVISGGASAISSGFAASILDSDHFGVSWQTAKLMSMTFVVAAGLALAAFLSKKPLPPVIETKTETTTTSPSGMIQEKKTTITTVHEDKAEAEPDKK